MKYCLLMNDGRAEVKKDERLTYIKVKCSNKYR